MVAGGFAGYDTYQETGDLKRSVATSALAGTAAGVGAYSGAILGGIIGSFIAPGPGTAIGAWIGGMIGGGAGGWGGKATADAIYENVPRDFSSESSSPGITSGNTMDTPEKKEQVVNDLSRNPFMTRGGYTGSGSSNTTSVIFGTGDIGNIASAEPAPKNNDVVIYNQQILDILTQNQSAEQTRHEELLAKLGAPATGSNVVITSQGGSTNNLIVSLPDAQDFRAGKINQISGLK